MAAWAVNDGNIHTLTTQMAVVHVPPINPKTTIMQIFDSLVGPYIEVIAYYKSATSNYIYFDLFDTNLASTKYYVTTSFALNTVFTLKAVFNAGTLKMYYNGNLVNMTPTSTTATYSITG